MSERRGSRWTRFLMMLPFFLIGIAIPVYFYGFSGDGPPDIAIGERSFEPAPAAAPDEETTQRRGQRFPIVGFMRRLFSDAIDNYVSPSLSKPVIAIGMLGVIFVVGYLVIRLLIGLFRGALSGTFSFLVHRAAGPMFMGFLAVGSTWGIHETVFREYGMAWAAATVSIVAAVATLLALAGVPLRRQ
jgi:hypothetical protein